MFEMFFFAMDEVASCIYVILLYNFNGLKSVFRYSEKSKDQEKWRTMLLMWDKKVVGRKGAGEIRLKRKVDLIKN